MPTSTVAMALAMEIAEEVQRCAISNTTNHAFNAFLTHSNKNEKPRLSVCLLALRNGNGNGYGGGSGSGSGKQIPNGHKSEHPCNIQSKINKNPDDGQVGGRTDGRGTLRKLFFLNINSKHCCQLRHQKIKPSTDKVFRPQSSQRSN
ncbi:unnamed protein product [Ceratitis capitata]|uniref:(Mediterranean fruit fly) hypothetical protein n=1 Tax=Ceratitis capitata TaxID=7213 RepID=A0A811UYL8_CERCA|nr:unnamed protein product [Ceratitis capitata]